MMRKKGLLILTLFIVASLLLMGNVFAKGPDTNGQAVGFYKASALNPSRTLLNINNWSYWQYYDGRSGVDPDGNSGGIFPRGTAGVVYEDGVVFGAVVNGQIRVGGQTYRVGTRAVLDHIYRIRSDWRTLVPAEVLQDAAEFYRKTAGSVTDAEIQALIEQYAADWENWPVDMGAPWTDVNGNGTYEPDVDIAGIASADQVIYYVVDDLDPGRTNNLYGSDPIGVRIDVTLWGYKQPGARLGQIIFKKYKFHNISGTTLQDMYFAQWVDPDIGNYTDDVVGCDSVLSLGFAYNGPETDNDFAAFGLAPAAMGYDFFQGPIIYTGNDADTAVFDLKKVPGAINLGMSSFGYFSAGNPEWDDPDLGSYDGTLQWYNLLRGYIPNTDVENPSPFTHRDTGVPTKFPLNGDPVTGTGDIDGQGANFAPADRRMSLNTGPFNMQPDDIQEVVVALIGGRPGESRVDAVADLKITDQIAQSLYDALFGTVPKAPPSPKVTVTPFETKILLSWGEDPDAVRATEETIYKDSPTTQYEFEGYNVYQLPNASAIDKAKRIATFDKINGVTTITGKRFLPEFGAEVVVPVQFGNDYGIQRYFLVEQNYLTGEPLYPGNEYYFAVTAYNYNPDPQLIEDKALESSITPIPVTTQSTKPGVRYGADAGTELEVTHTSGSSDGQVRALVVDPAALTGHQYEIFFELDDDTTSPTFGEILWGVRDVTTGEVKARGLQQATDLNTPDGLQIIIDGIEFTVAGPPKDYKDFMVVANANGPLPEPVGAAPDWYGFPGLGRPTDAQQVGDGHWMFHCTTLSDGSYETFRYRTTQYSGGFGEPNQGIQAIIPDDYEIRFTDAGGEGFFNWTYSVQKGDSALRPVPFEVWNIVDANNPDDDFKIMPFILDMENVENQGVFNITNLDHAASSANNDPVTDAIYMVQPEDRTPGDAGYQAIKAFIESTPDTLIPDYFFWAIRYENFSVPAIMRLLFFNWNGGDVPDTEAEWTTYPYNQLLPEKGTIFRIVTTKPNTVNDVFSIQAPAVEVSAATAKADVEKLSVYPNPYYAYNPQEPNRFTKFITFYHLPQKATIRIFALDGTHVVTLNKDDDSQFLRWNLQNKNGLPVASGIYIAHVKMTLDDGSVVEKSLKIFIIQEQQILKYF